jgi:flagellar M-ring protein FliF
MRDRVLTWGNVVSEKWRNFTKFQKIRVAAITGITLLAIGLMLFFALRPNWTPVAGNFDNAAHAMPLRNMLEEHQIRTRVVGGTIYVDAADQHEAALVLATSTLDMSGRFTFFDLLAQSQMGITSTLQHEMIVNAAATDIEMMLMASSIMADARVLLNIHSDINHFIAATNANSASISVRGNRPLTALDGANIAAVVANAVPRMDMENIVVTDTNMMVLFAGDVAVDDPMMEHMQEIQLERDLTRQMEQNVTRQLRMNWPQVEVMISTVFDRDRVHEISRRFFSPVGPGTSSGLYQTLVEQSRDGTMLDSGGGLGETGVGANAGVPGYLMTNQSGEASIEEMHREITFVHDEIMREVTSGGPGRVVLADSSVGIFVLRNIYYRQDDLEARGIIGEDFTWADFQAANADRRLVNGPELDAEVAAIRASTGIENVVITAFEQPRFIDSAPPAPIDVWNWILLALAMLMVIVLAFFLIRRPVPEIVTEIEPELSVEDLLVSSQIEEEKDYEIERLAEIRLSGDSEAKGQIDKFTEEKPEAVAQLLRNWINEDWE